MGDLEELPRQLAELRELIREGHAVIKDMTGLLREFRRLQGEGAEQARAAAHDAAAEEMGRAAAHIQSEMDRQAAELNRAVQRARYQVVKALTVTGMESGPDGKGLKVSFAGNLFDAGDGP